MRCAPREARLLGGMIGVTKEEIAAIIEAVDAAGLTYMMGVQLYNPATVYARERFADGAFGRLLYAEGDYLHDMELGFYEAYQYGGGENWKATASYPPLLYPTHSIGGVSAPGRPTPPACSAIGVPDTRSDGLRQGGQPVRQ